MPSLSGRARELLALDQHLAGPVAGQWTGQWTGQWMGHAGSFAMEHAAMPPPLLLLAGEPGIGKSRLLDEAARRASAAGWTVLSAGCHRNSGQEPYAPLLEALARHVTHRTPAQLRVDLEGCGWLVRLLPELADRAIVPAPSWTLPPEQERRLMVAAVGRFLANIAGPAGTLMVLDDLQWAGTDALDLLRSVLAGPTVADGSAQPARVVGAYRDTDIAHDHPLGLLLADLAGAGLAMQVQLAPLSREESFDLLSSLLADPVVTAAHTPSIPGPALQSVLDRAGGVPFFLVSCAQELAAERARDVQAGTLSSGSSGSDGARDANETGTGSAAVPWSVAVSIRSRVALLDKAAADVLAVAAVAGQMTHYRVLRAAATTAALDDADIVAALDAACHAQLLAESGDGLFAFTHDLIREVVAADLSRARRALLHRRVAGVLELMPDAEREHRAAELAWHFHEAGDPARALTYALQAGDRARALYAYEQAQHHYRDAVELARECASARDEAGALERLGLVFRLAARREEAFAVLLEAADLYRQVGDRDGLGRTTAFIAIGDLGSGKQQQGLTAMRATLDSFGPVDDTELSARTLADIFLAQAYLSDTPGEKLHACERAARHIHPVEGLSRIAEVERVRGAALIQLGRLGEAVHAFETASTAAQGTGDVATLQHVLNNLALIHAAKGELAHAQQYYERALGVAEEVHASALIAVVRCNMSRLAFVSGDWPRVRAELELAVELPAAGESWVATWAAREQLGELCLAQGPPEQGGRCLDEAVMLARRHDRIDIECAAQRALAEFDLITGQADAARARLEPILERGGDSTIYSMAVVPWLAPAYLDLGQERRAADLSEQVVGLVRGAHVSVYLVDALRMQARVWMRQERWEQATAALEETLTTCRMMPCPWGEAKALYVYGQLHVATGEPAQARERFKAALGICDRLGEGLYRPYIERALADLG